MLHHEVETVFVADSGSDRAVIGQNHVDKLAQGGVLLKMQKLEEPFVVSMADGRDGRPVKWVSSVDLELFPGSESLKVRNVEVYIVEGDMPEVLLGQSFLLALGIDVEDQLAARARSDGEVDWALEAAVTTAELGALGHSFEKLRLRRTHEEDMKFYRRYCHREGQIPSDHPDFGDTVPDPWPDIDSYGGNDPEELHAALNKLVEEAARLGAKESVVEGFRTLVHEFFDVWRVRLGVDPPVDVPPMVVKLKEGAKPIRAATRRYPPLARDFMKVESDRQVRLGLAYRNPNSQWASCPLVVKKRVVEGAPLPPLINMFRMTVDSRAVNDRTEDVAWPMPNLEVVLDNLRHAKFYAPFDLTSGYWQFPLSECSQEMFSYLTDQGVFTPTRVPQGAKGSVAYFQASMQLVLGDQLYRSVLLWLDDLLVYSDTQEGLLEAVRELFERCRRVGLKLHAGKSQVFQVQVVWCGRLISANGVAQDPARLIALRNLPKPTTGADLQQFVCAVNWLRMSLPNYAPTIAPLLALMEAIYLEAGSRKKRKVEKLQLAAHWRQEHDHAWEATKGMLARSCTQAHIVAEYKVCVFTDASDYFWSAFVTQIPPEDESKPFAEQRHELLACLSHAFRGAQLRWAMVDKEAYAIVETCVRLEYMLLRPGGFTLYTDHRNLTYIFDPHKACPGIQRHTAAKVQRWALTLAAFEYEVEFVQGPKNLWADLLSRWGASEEADTKAWPKVQVNTRRVLLVPLNPTEAKDFDWPTPAKLHDAQEEAIEAGLEAVPESGSFDDQGLWRVGIGGPVWVPEGATQLQLRLCIIAHAGLAGHRGVKATTTAIESEFHWPTLRSDVKEFVRQCLHCLATTGGNTIPRPYGEAIHAELPNEAMHMDWLFLQKLPKGAKSEQYAHVCKDDASSLCQLRAYRDPTAENVVTDLETWGGYFGVPRVWISDGGSHYKSQVLEEFRRRYGSSHNIVVAYSPWANGTVETLMSQILRVLRALLNEFQMQPTEWPCLLPMVQSALNLAPSERFGGKSPMEVFTGLKPKRPIASILHPVTGAVCDYEAVKRKVASAMKDLAEARDKLHKQAAVSAKQVRDRRRMQANKKRGAKFPSFIVGDFVLVGREAQVSGDKLRVRWRGPRRITAIRSPWVYEVEDLVHGRRKEVHATRLKFYQDKDLGVTEELRVQAAHSERINEVNKFTGLRFDEEAKTWFIQVIWRGFEPADATWEPLAIIAEDVPELVQQYLASSHVSQGEALRVGAWLNENRPAFPAAPPARSGRRRRQQRTQQKS